MTRLLLRGHIHLRRLIVVVVVIIGVVFLQVVVVFLLQVVVIDRNAAAFIMLVVVCCRRRCRRRGCRRRGCRRRGCRLPVQNYEKLMAWSRDSRVAPFQVEGIDGSQLITLQSVFFVPESCVDVYAPTPNTRTRSKPLSVYVYLAWECISRCDTRCDISFVK